MPRPSTDAQLSKILSVDDCLLVEDGKYGRRNRYHNWMDMANCMSRRSEKPDEYFVGATKHGREPGLIPVAKIWLSA